MLHIIQRNTYMTLWFVKIFEDCCRRKLDKLRLRSFHYDNDHYEFPLFDQFVQFDYFDIQYLTNHN